MKRNILWILFFLVTASGFGKAPATDNNDSWQVKIPYKKFVLKNGLTLIVHEDHKAPIVAVNVWYHVGSKNEKPGKTGFAHLFEHLMFNGSEHFNDDYFKAMEKVGATDMNGTTNKDRTNYFENVPTSALDLALWMESDRMGHLLGAIDKAKLDEQRGVVQNEKRQGENRPYGKVFLNIAENTYPKGHPYSWTTIGSMEDLNAASLDDVRQWFKTYYGAANAVLVVAGDVKTEMVHQKVGKYFGDIPSGPPITKQEAWVAKMHGSHRQIMQDRVPQARIYKVWNVPPYGTRQATLLDLAGDILSRGKTSRLYKRLVYDDQIATGVSAGVATGEIGSQFLITATSKPGQSLPRVEQELNEELARFLEEGPSPDELQRVKTQYLSGFVRGIERIGGFGGKSDILAINQVYTGEPDHYKTALKWVHDATQQQLQKVARQWLSDGVYNLEVHPFPHYGTAKTDVDRSKLPDTGTPPEAHFPELHRATLSNGLKVIVAERHSIPVIDFDLLVDAGYASDQFGIPGTAQLAMSMLDEGTKTRTALQISDELARLGARLNTGSDLDSSSVFLSALKQNLDKSLDIFGDVILNPSFPEADFKRQRNLQLARIQREKVTPIQMALRVYPSLLYGKDHAYGNPFTGSGTKDAVSRITRQELVRFHDTWFKPNHSSLVVVGDTTLAEIQPKLEQLFASWKAGNVPTKNVARVQPKSSDQVYILDRPDSEQSIIFAGNVAPPTNNPQEPAIQAMNNILGGTFTSRINMNLREDKHWSYGAFSVIPEARGQRPFFIYAPVQTDKTKESLAEIQKELRSLLGTDPVTPQELQKTIKNETLRLPGSWETIASVENSISEIVTYGLGDDYYQTYAGKVKNLTLQEVNAAAREVVHPGHLVWVVVGDRSKIEPGIRELNLGPIHFIDADGNVLE